MVWNSENPIIDVKEDILNRGNFSRVIAKQIEDYGSKECLVIGLLGRWGSGKSSLLNMVEQQLNHEKVGVIRFTPWYFESRKQIVADFFSVLSEYINRIEWEKKGDLGKALETFSHLIRPLTLVPQVNLVIDGVCTVLDSVSSALKSQEEATDLDEIKKSIADDLAEYPKKLVIFIDEIDRLEESDAKQIFQLVRALGDFPNLIYVLAFDDKKVFSNEEDIKYLEKIITVPIYVPMVSQRNLQQYFKTEYEKIISIPLNEQEYWDKINQILFMQAFDNLRDVKRYINLLQFYYGVIKQDLNVIDYSVMIFLQLFEPNIFTFLKEKGIYLCSCDGVGNSYKTDTASVLEQIKNVELNKHFDILSLLEVMFSQERMGSNRPINNRRHFISFFSLYPEESICSLGDKNKLLSIKTVKDVEELYQEWGISNFVENIIEVINCLSEEINITLMSFVVQNADVLEYAMKNFNRIISHKGKHVYNAKMQYLIENANLKTEAALISILEAIPGITDDNFTNIVHFLCCLKSKYQGRFALDYIEPKLQKYMEQYSIIIYRQFDNLKYIGVDIYVYRDRVMHDSKFLLDFLEHSSSGVWYQTVQTGFDQNAEPTFDYVERVELTADDIDMMGSTKEELLSIINSFSAEEQKRYQYMSNQIKKAIPVAEYYMEESNE